MYNDIHLDWGLMFYKFISHPIDVNYSDNWFFIIQPNIQSSSLKSNNPQNYTYPGTCNKIIVLHIYLSKSFKYIFFLHVGSNVYNLNLNFNYWCCVSKGILTSQELSALQPDVIPLLGRVVYHGCFVNDRFFVDGPNVRKPSICKRCYKEWGIHC